LHLIRPHVRVRLVNLLRRLMHFAVSVQVEPKRKNRPCGQPPSPNPRLNPHGGEAPGQNPGSLVPMAAAAARFLLPTAARTAASPSAAALLCVPLDSFSRRCRALAPPSAVFSRNLSDTAFDAQALDTRVPATVITGFLGSGKVTPPLPLPLVLPPFPCRNC
jgi:hypothetical protein